MMSIVPYLTDYSVFELKLCRTLDKSLKTIELCFGFLILYQIGRTYKFGRAYCVSLLPSYQEGNDTFVSNLYNWWFNHSELNSYVKMSRAPPLLGAFNLET